MYHRSGSVRREQAHAVKEEVDASPYPVILAGDFNVAPESKTIAELKKGMTILNDTAVCTFPSSGPSCCIDYIMVNTPFADRVSVIDRRVIADPGATDHCAVIIKANLQ